MYDGLATKIILIGIKLSRKTMAIVVLNRGFAMRQRPALQVLNCWYVNDIQLISKINVEILTILLSGYCGIVVQKLPTFTILMKPSAWMIPMK
jgi:hypothetical protein